MLKLYKIELYCHTNNGKGYEKGVRIIATVIAVHDLGINLFT